MINYYKKNIVKSFRIDSETADLMQFCKKNNIKYWSDLRENIKEILKEKAKEFNFKEKKIKYPF